MPVTESYFAFLDTETGGVVPGKDPVIEIATILTDLKRVEIARFDAKIKLRVGDTVQPAAAAINGYDPAVWAKEAVPFHQYVQFLKRNIPYGSVAIPVGHRVPFDREMIDVGYYKPMQLFNPLGYRMADTLSMAMALRCAGVIEVENLQLATVAKALGIPTPASHRAMGDCETAKAVFERCVDLFIDGAARRLSAGAR